MPTKQYPIPKELVELLPGYLSRRLQDIQDLSSYQKQSDFAAIQKLGHKLRGNGASFGFDKISEIGLQLEAAAKQQDLEKILGLILNLKIETETIKISFQM